MIHFLFHRWKPTAVSLSSGGSYTIVLYRCRKCDRLRTKELQGNWSLKQVGGDGQADILRMVG